TMEILIVLGVLIGFIMIVYTSYSAIVGAFIVISAAISLNYKLADTGLAFIVGMLFGLATGNLRRGLRNRIVIGVLCISVVAIIILAIVTRILGYRIFY
ncbi:MAG TPA: hypothetical protein VJ028_03185, partial [Patescibacteria group bacterium]|nr:hypothetical protein [Patescibacteria group bacterium]